MSGPGVRTRKSIAALPDAAGRRIERPPSEARVRVIVEGLWALQLPLCYVEVASVNAYLLRVEQGWLLIDCGSSLAPGWEALALALTEAGAALEDVELLVVTHSHADHRGLAAEIVERAGPTFAMGSPPHPRIDVLRDVTLPIEARRTRGRREGVPERLLDALVDDVPAGDGRARLVDPDRVLQPGEQLASNVGPWEIVPAPGHSADQIVLWNARHRLLIGADLALPGLPSFLEYGTRPDPHADQVASLERAIALEPELLLAGHGRPTRSAVPALLDCRKKVLDRLASVRAAVGASPVSAWDVVELMSLPRANADSLQRVLSETLCVLEHLEMRDEVRAVVDDHGARRWLACSTGAR